MAGSNPDFPSDTFRDVIRSTMTLGAPVNPSDRVTFKWNTERTFDRADPAGVPYDPNAAADTTTPHADVQVPAAVQFGAVGEEQTAVGPFDTSKAVITLLDVDYALVSDADFVLLGGDTYDIDSVIPLGLYDVGVYQMHVHARSRA